MMAHAGPKQFCAALLFPLLLVWLPLRASAFDVPPRTSNYVNDFAGIIEAGDERNLESALAAFDQSTSNQIVVVTMPALTDITPEEATLKIAEAWKPGVQGRDNGVVVGVFPEDRVARIEVGYGLEGAIPDAIAATIMRNDMVPRFREGDWAGGIRAGLAGLMQAAKGEYNEARPTGKPMALPLLFWSILLVIALAVRFFFRAAIGQGFSTYGPGGRSYGGGWHGRGGPWGGGGFGGRGGFGGGGGFSGGGGGFGGGGASGRW